MFEATAQTLASTPTTWVIVIVMLIATATMIGAPVVADIVQGKEAKRDREARGLTSGNSAARLAADSAQTTPGGNITQGGQAEHAEHGSAASERADEAGR